MGGVENHIYHLSKCLTDRGHLVTIVTHSYPPKRTSGTAAIYDGRIRVHYLPFPVIYNQCTFPAVFPSSTFYWKIFTEESIELVHGHQAFSVMCHEGILHARTMGIPCCFTDHSLFGFADTSSILTNKLLKFTLSDVASVICVSHTSRENTVLRAALDPDKVHVIPNAIDSSLLFPPGPDTSEEGSQSRSRIVVIVLCRLVYRKGIDLLVNIVPAICALHPNVDFYIAGDGPKKIDLEQMRERHRLYERVQLAGAIPTDRVRSTLNRGDIFLNCSLTEAFCMAIVEAACCGLRVVSTRVGGIPEVLPEDIVGLADARADALISALGQCIRQPDLKCPARRMLQHERVREMYSWEEVALRTEAAYTSALKDARTPLIERIKRYYGCGEVAGKLFLVFVLLDYILHQLLK